MKKILWILLFLPLSLFAQEHYYYYKGQKQYLQLDTNYVFVSTTNGNILQKSSVLSDVSLVLNKKQHVTRLSQKESIPADFYWAEVQLPELRMKKTSLVSTKKSQ